MKKRILAFLLCVVMLMGVMPITALADGEPFTAADYEVAVQVSTETDRDTTNEMVDVFAGDTVTAVVKVKSATKSSFVAADVTLGYDKANFKMTSSPLQLWEGDLAMGGSFLPLYNPTVQGSSRFYNASPDNAYEMTAVEGSGWEYILGTFTFEALPGEDAAMNVPFTVNTKSAYVAELWSAGWSSDAAIPVADGNLENDAANIRLKEMTASVTKAQKEGGGNLVYSGPNANLHPVQDGYTAKDTSNGAAITDATIKYAVLTKAEVEGTVQSKDGSNNLLYVDPTDNTKTTTEAQHIQYYTDQTKTTTATEITAYFDMVDNTPKYDEAKTPATEDYSSTNPTVTNAGDYVVFYQVAKPGYVTVSDKINVTIDKASITLSWDHHELETVATGMTDGKGDAVTSDYYKNYASGTIYTSPTATYMEAGTNQTKNATVTEANGGILNATGTYTFTGTIDDNYTITNPTKTVLIDGGKIVGYTLKNTDEGTWVWYDGNAHDAAKLTEAGAKTEDVIVQYSIDGGTTWVNEMPKVTEVSKNTVQMKLTKDGYYDVIQSVPFEIKNVEYKVEKSDWVTGYDIVLVYTNDTVPGFKYNDAMMYNLSGMANKYKYGTTEYTYVYGLVVYGDADITKVVPSNIAALTIDYDGTTDSVQIVQSSQYDVNSSTSTDINDLTAVQGTYNVGAEYMDASTHAVTQMTVVLRADVNRDKKVDTIDCSQIKANTAY